MRLSLRLPSACCCCCGADGCGWNENWLSLQDWTQSGGEASGGQYRVEGVGVAFAERDITGAYSILTTVTPPPGDGDQAGGLLTTDVLEHAPLYAQALTDMGATTWFVVGTVVPGAPVAVSPSNPGDAQVVVLAWNDAGEWSVTIGDADPVTGTGLVGDQVPTLLMFGLTDASGAGSPSIGSTTAACVPMPPLPTLPFAEVVLGLGPEFYFVLDQTGSDNPVDSSPHALVAQLNAPYAWGQPGPVTGLDALELTGGWFLTTTRVALTASQSRMAFVQTTSTDAVPDYEGDAALTVLGDSTADVWDSFGVTDGKATYTRFNGSAWQVFTGSTVVNDGAWHMIVATYDSGTLEVKLYVDGVLDGGGSMTGHQAKGGIDRYGRGYSGADVYLGNVGQVAAWASALTAGDVTALWEAVAVK